MVSSFAFLEAYVALIEKIWTWNIFILFGCFSFWCGVEELWENRLLFLEATMIESALFNFQANK